METEQDNRSNDRVPLVGRRLVWTIVLLVLAVLGFHYGTAEWDHWVRRGLGW